MRTSDLPEAMAFEFGCSTLPFGAMDYWILTHQGSHLRGTAVPRSGNEHYFIRCIREEADYDSHQCLEADAWRKWVERRAFEASHPPRHPNRTWIRTRELREGMILARKDGSFLLVEGPFGFPMRAPSARSSSRKLPRISP